MGRALYRLARQESSITTVAAEASNICRKEGFLISPSIANKIKTLEKKISTLDSQIELIYQVEKEKPIKKTTGKTIRAFLNFRYSQNPNIAIEILPRKEQTRGESLIGMIFVKGRLMIG